MPPGQPTVVQKEFPLHTPPYRKTIRSLHALDLAADNADVNAYRKGTEPALVWASHYGTPAVVRALLARGANVNARDQRGRTALHYAAWNGEVTGKHVRILIAAGADIDAKDCDGRIPLMLAGGASTLRMLQKRRPKMTLREEVETALRPLYEKPPPSILLTELSPQRIGCVEPLFHACRIAKSMERFLIRCSCFISTDRHNDRIVTGVYLCCKPEFIFWVSISTSLALPMKAIGSLVFLFENRNEHAIRRVIPSAVSGYDPPLFTRSSGFQ